MAYGPVNVPGADDKALEAAQNLAQAAKNVADIAASAIAAHKEARNPHGLTASDVSAVPATRKINNKPLSSDITLTLTDLGGIFYAGKTAPSDTKKLWIDTTATTGGLKYHNGSAWVHVPVATT